MAGMPQRRARLERERLFAAPAIIPPEEFRNLSAGQKMEHLLGCSLDDAYIITHWDTNKADVHQLSAKVRVIEIMTKHGFRFAVEAMRDQGRDRAIEQLAQAITDRVSSDPEAWAEHYFSAKTDPERPQAVGPLATPAKVPLAECPQAIGDKVVTKDHLWLRYNEHDQSYRCSHCGVMQGPGYLDPPIACTPIPTNAHGSALEPGHTRDTKDVTP